VEKELERSKMSEPYTMEDLPPEDGWVEEELDATSN